MESLYWTAFHATRVRTISACRVMLGKLPLTMSRVSYGTPLSVILTCNSETTSSILTKVSESKRSSMDNMLGKFRSLENVAMETVTNSLLFFFEWPVSQQGVKVLSWFFGNVCSWTKGTFYVHNTISLELQIFRYNQAKFQPGSCGCQVSYGTLISPILIYNSKTRNLIFTKFSASKSSSLEKMSAKFRRPEIVAMETVTDSFVLFNARYLSGGGGGGSIHCLEFLRICSARPKAHFMFVT